MSFKKFLQDFDKEYQDYVLENVKKQQEGFNGRKIITNGKTTLLAYNSWDEKTLQLFTAYRNERTTKRLVGATWFLAITTIILAIISLFVR